MTRNVIGMVACVLSIGICAAGATDVDRPVFDIPAISDIEIDGDAGDWDGSGFAVDAFYPRDGKVTPADDFQPRARWAWDEDGLLLLMTVLQLEVAMVLLVVMVLLLLVLIIMVLLLMLPAMLVLATVLLLVMVLLAKVQLLLMMLLLVMALLVV